jgi:hypothetical protein
LRRDESPAARNCRLIGAIEFGAEHRERHSTSNERWTKWGSFAYPVAS